MKIRKSSTRDEDAVPQVIGRRSLRNVKPVEEDKRSHDTDKKKRAASKKEEPKKEDNKKASETEGLGDEGDVKDGESSEMSKPATSKNIRVGKKRPLSETVEGEDEEDRDTGKDENKVEQKDESKEDEDEETEDKKVEEKSESKEDEKRNGKAENGKKLKGRKRRKPVRKEVEEIQEVWTPLEELEGESMSKRDTQKRIQNKNDRRKQSLVERDGAAEVMLQTLPSRHRNNSDVSDCEVLDSVPQLHPRKMGAIETVEIDDDQSEEGSNFCEIVAESDTDSTFDFKRLLIQSRLVNLPSPLWAEHHDPRGHFVSFTRFNPDYPNHNDVIVDRAVVFQDSLNPEVFINGKKMEIPEMFHVVETLLEVSQIVQFANNFVAPIGPVEPVEQDGS